jgi:D-alanyl-D-alanine endopeptidase (penicillin-binding protein 7)
MGGQHVRTLALISCLVAILAMASGGPSYGAVQTAKASAEQGQGPGRVAPKTGSGKRSVTASNGAARGASKSKSGADTPKAATSKRTNPGNPRASGNLSRNGKVTKQAAAKPKRTVSTKQAARKTTAKRGGGTKARTSARRTKPQIVRAKAVGPNRSASMRTSVWHQPIAESGSLQDDVLDRALSHLAGLPRLSSESVLVVDKDQDRVLFEKNSSARQPIASITKLMTAMVVLDASQPSQELLTITDADVDRLKNSRSRLPVGTRLTRGELLHLALLASENRAASALCRYYPGGKNACVASMNRKASLLGMTATHFDDPTGLIPSNTSTARDLQRMARAAYTYPAIRQITSSPEYVLDHQGRLDGVHFRNTNRLVRSDDWTIGLSKTGYIQEAGRCLVMQADIANRPTLIVLLHGEGRGSHFVDAKRLRQWLERHTLVSSNDP